MDKQPDIEKPAELPAHHMGERAAKYILLAAITGGAAGISLYAAFNAIYIPMIPEVWKAISDKNYLLLAGQAVGCYMVYQAITPTALTIRDRLCKILDIPIPSTNNPKSATAHPPTDSADPNLH